MAKKLFTLLCGSVLAFPVLALLVQAAPAQEKMEKMDKMTKQDRWEGTVIRSSPDKSALTVRKPGSSERRLCSTIARPNRSAKRTAAKRSTILMPAKLKMVIE